MNICCELNTEDFGLTGFLSPGKQFCPPQSVIVTAYITAEFSTNSQDVINFL